MSHEALGSGCIDESKNDLSIHMNGKKPGKNVMGLQDEGRTKKSWKKQNTFIFVMFHHPKKPHVVGLEKGFFKFCWGKKILHGKSKQK